MEIARGVSAKLGIDLHVVLYVYTLYYEAIVDKMESIDFDSIDIESDEANTSFNLQYIGKLYTSSKVVDKINKNKIKGENESIEY